jgi:diguanylate cyclase (GGDEF)-like protein
VGDLVLKAMAAAIQTQTRGGDIIARVGGEEFAVLLPGATNIVTLSVGERIRAAIASVQVSTGDNTEAIAVTVSAGAALFSPGCSAELLYQNADRALYSAKNAGRNQLMLED